MHGAMLLMAMLAPGVDAGWQNLPDGGMEFIIQIEPYQLDSLRAGEEITSELPPDLRDIRRYRVRSGTGLLPHEQPPVEPLVTEQPVIEQPPVSSDVPAPFPPHPADLAVYNETQSSAKPDATAATEEVPAAGKPWLTLVAVLIAFFATLAGLVYTGWIAWDYRRRYQQLLASTATAEGAT